MHEQLLRESRDAAIALELERDRKLWQTVESVPPSTDGPNIWVGTVCDYLASQPWGAWISVGSSVERVERGVGAVVASAPSTEQDTTEGQRWHVFSHTGFGRHPPKANLSLREIVRHADRYREDLRAYAAWAWIASDDRTWLSQFYDHYQGRYEQVEDWLTIEIERAGYDRVLDEVVPGHLRPHVDINVASMAHELRVSQAIITIRDADAGGLFVFRNPNTSTPTMLRN